MNEIKHEELFGNLKNFLKSKGIELGDGSYTKRVQQGCEILADSINMGQGALGKAKTVVDNGLNQLRQTIHEKTAPKAPVKAATATSAPPKPKAASSTRKPPVVVARKPSKPGRRKG